MKKMKYPQVGIVAIIGITMLCLIVVPLVAEYNFEGFPVETKISGFVNGGVFIDYEPWAGTTTLTGEFDVPEGEVKWARLYTGIWGGNPRNNGWLEVTFNGVDNESRLGQIHLQGESDTNPNVWCSGNGKHWMYYNVTDLVAPGSTNTATTSKINGSIDGRAYGIVLIVVYEGGNNPKEIQYWINEGSDALHYADAAWPPVSHDTGISYFNGTVNTEIVTKANLTLVHLTAYDPGCNSCLKFNEHELNTSMVDSNTIELNTWNVTGHVASTDNSVFYSRGEDEYINVANAILVLERRTVEETDTNIISYLFLLLNLSMPASALADNQSESVDESIEMPDLIITAITPYHLWSEKYDIPAGDPWFNLRNYAEVRVSNNGTADADESFEVILYADDEPIGSETVDELPAGMFTDVKFSEWMLEGEDPLSWTDTAEGAICVYTDTSKVLKAVVDEEDEVLEADDANNEFTTEEQKVVWNGYMADEPLENYVHGDVEGGIIYTTGDGEYRSYISGDRGTDDTYYAIKYDLEIPEGTKLARLYIYYTWAKPSYTAPKIGVTLTTPSDDRYNLDMEKSYNDIKGDFGADIYAWGTYAYDITEYMKESGSYVVSVKNLNYGGDDSDFAGVYSFAPPAILVVYVDTTMPKREYWINEGADLLMGGGEERPYGGFLSLAECKNTATFEEDIDLSEVEEAVLGVVSIWGGNPASGWHSYLYFNENELGMDMYDGYSGTCSEERGGISMCIGSNNAQVGLVLTDVTDDLERNDNMVIQGDDGDNMMPANAFLVITYEEEEEEEREGEEGKVTPTFPNITACSPVESIVNNTEGESRTFNISVNQTVDISWQINGTEVQTEEAVTEAVYTNTNAVAGTWNVSVIATNVITELQDMHSWIWNVTPAPTATPTPALNISTTPISAPTPVPTVTPKPTPALTPSTEEKEAATEEETPGFELVISLFMLLLVAYLIRRR